MEGLGRIALLFLVALTGHAFFAYLQQYVNAVAGQRTLADLRLAVYRHVQELPMAFFERTPIGRLMTRMTTDLENLSEAFSSGLVQLVGDVVLMIVLAVVMMVVNWKLALVAFVVVPVLSVLAGIFRYRFREAFRAIRVRIARINAYLQENISGMRIVQLFTRENHNLESFRQINNAYRRANMRSIRYDSMLFSIAEAATRFTTALIIWYGSGFYKSGALELGLIYSFIHWMDDFFVPIRDLSMKYSIMQSAMASSERIFQLFDEPITIRNPEKPVSIGRMRGEIEFRNVSFAYKPDQWVLKDLSFRVRPGERVAIVGATGAGKTTIIKLLSRLYDIQRGEILVDGVGIRKLDQEDLRRELSVVLQDVMLFSGSVAENITLGDESIDEARMRAAAVAVNAHRFIERLPEGYRQEVGERGSTLSMGQRQLVSFARALAHRPAVLILDEATSSIDTETELLIQDALHKLMEGRTSIVIAHRLSTIRDVDRILVLHKGELRESGTHAELLALRGIYYRLYEIQYKQQERLLADGTGPQSTRSV